MKKVKLNAVLIALIILLLASNISTILTYRNHLNDEQVFAEKRAGIPETRMGRYFNEELSLNNVQMDQFREFRRLYNRSANAMLSDMQDLRNKMAHELNRKKPDRLRLDELAGSLGQFHTELKGLTFDYYFSMQRVLDEEQQNKMIDIFQAMLTEQGFAKTPNHSHEEGADFQRGEGRGRGGHTGAYEIDSTNIDNTFYDYNQ